ncbi:hypothetical protein J2W51_003360 [Tardiphaga robiniae]|uniref:hypothetical protein n=1 Tax=Tardiphaga robiniae TaxID=943830 RepID=UPI0028551FD7|nr:hypothetical protein [Tardiphaga robiniae]MDR6660790.1 hypothetical protein [Tardiphaga robiniae]
MTKVITDLKLSDSSYSHVLDIAADKIDIADWLFNLPNDEYKRCCPPDHVACGATYTDDGKRMSINVERIGETLMIQQYVGEITEKHHCRMVSISDAFTPNGRTKVQIIWDLSIKPIDADHCEYTNSVIAHPTEEFLAFLKEHNVSFETAAAGRQAAGGDHNHRETPLFAESMKRKALARK